MADDDDENRDDDPRFDFILQFLLKSTKLKMDLWHKLKSTNDYKVYSKETTYNY